MSKEFEIARLQLVSAGKAGAIDEARAFAWAHRVHPLRSTPLEEKFAEDFEIGREKVDEVLRIVDQGWRDGKLVTYYELEGLGGSGVGLARMELVAVLRMAFLDRRFDKSVWNELVKPGSGPIESQGMTDPFSSEDDFDY
ncbi:hypothetical protein ACVWZ6_005608 [Bradyrhizobium sp. GM6.1]